MDYASSLSSLLSFLSKVSTGVPSTTKRARQDAVGEIKRVVPIELEGVAHGGFVFAGDVIEERDHGVGHVGSVEAVNCSAKYVDALGYELR